VVHVFQTLQIWSFHVFVLQRTAKKYTKNYNTLYCSLILLFSDVPVAVAVVVVAVHLVVVEVKYVMLVAVVEARRKSDSSSGSGEW